MLIYAHLQRLLHIVEVNVYIFVLVLISLSTANYSQSESKQSPVIGISLHPFKTSNKSLRLGLKPDFLNVLEATYRSEMTRLSF